jgi:hypothetical protein
MYLLHRYRVGICAVRYRTYKGSFYFYSFTFHLSLIFLLVPFHSNFIFSSLFFPDVFPWMALTYSVSHSIEPSRWLGFDSSCTGSNHWGWIESVSGANLIKFTSQYFDHPSKHFYAQSQESSCRYIKMLFFDKINGSRKKFFKRTLSQNKYRYTLLLTLPLK